MPRDSQNTRERILVAGGTLIARRGLANVNSNEIARSAGVGVGTFYSHFRDKHELHGALVEQTVEELRVAVQAGLQGAGPKAADQVRAMIEAAVALAERAPERFQVAFGAEASSPGRRANVSLSTRGTELALKGLQKRGRLEAQIDARVAARAFSIMQNGLLCWWLESQQGSRGKAVSRRALIETLVALHPATAGRPRAPAP